MSGRMTDERLANLQKWLGAEHGDHPVTLELLQALKAERQEVERLREWVDGSRASIREADWNAAKAKVAEAQLERARELPEKLRRPSAHTYASENADVYAAYDRGRKSAADELEAALQSKEVSHV